MYFIPSIFFPTTSFGCSFYSCCRSLPLRQILYILLALSLSFPGDFSLCGFVVTCFFGTYPIEYTHPSPFLSPTSLLFIRKWTSIPIFLSFLFHSPSYCSFRKGLPSLSKLDRVIYIYYCVVLYICIYIYIYISLTCVSRHRSCAPLIFSLPQITAVPPPFLGLLYDSPIFFFFFNLFFFWAPCFYHSSNMSSSSPSSLLFSSL